jgi:hypothetical protein
VILNLLLDRFGVLAEASHSGGLARVLTRMLPLPQFTVSKGAVSHYRNHRHLANRSETASKRARGELARSAPFHGTAGAARNARNCQKVVTSGFSARHDDWAKVHDFTRRIFTGERWPSGEGTRLLIWRTLYRVPRVRIPPSPPKSRVFWLSDRPSTNPANSQLLRIA